MARIAVCLMLVVALSGGGGHLRAGLSIGDDDTVDGQVLLYFDEDYLDEHKNSEAALQVGFNNVVGQYPALPSGTEKTYSKLGSYGVEIDYTDTPVLGFSSDALMLTRDGNEYEFTFPVSSSADHGESLDALSIEISLTFPGRVLETNGTVNGNSVTWQYAASDAKPGELTAVACASAAADACPEATDTDTGTGTDFLGWGWWALAMGVVLLLGVVALVGLGLLRRRRGKPILTSGGGTPQPPPSPADPTADSMG
ncbi:DUF3153 domain-containing protein [Micromonospora sp. WMMA1363]|uniref:LppM family (lipo)protein n=1 Tax=Micromonospora sp. WMMA1363 TaxID=3053985 RepID=UPI00259CBBA4|nr:DUF3153 domain-containing protein [Micromonospora sp. WMMA1363]MDM4719672.1 DUF3153 domain-containing protein [Micromonospora sp. WMMA1363]